MLDKFNEGVLAGWIGQAYALGEGLPPISLFIGTHDLSLPDSRKLKEMMRAAKRPFNYFEYPNMMHDWIIVVDMEEAKQAIEQVSRLIVAET